MLVVKIGGKGLLPVGNPYSGTGTESTFKQVHTVLCFDPINRETHYLNKNMNYDCTCVQEAQGRPHSSVG